MKVKTMVALCCTGLLAASCATYHNEYEYRVIGPTTPNKEATINQLGKEGWQLVDTDPLKGFLFRRAKPKP